MTNDRTAALITLREHVHNEYLIARMVASEAMMKAIARGKGEDKEVWRLASLHNLNAEETGATRHSLESVDSMRRIRGELVL